MATISVFWQVKNHDFVNYDDDKYVTENYHVQGGLTWEGVKWAFTTTHASNWHPLTWLSHMLDCELYGLNAGWHHVTNLLFHLTSTLLLFLILNRMTGALWRSGVVAALFALHPLHVESVAWLAERKDVLSTFFWMLTMWAYIRYAERPAIKTYLLVLLFFAFGLMSKPMIVTLPFVLLLMDYWPLGRLKLGQSNKDRALNIEETPVTRLLWEKVPFFALTAVSSIVTFLAQQSGGAVVSLDKFPLAVRTANALVSYVSYIGKMIWPQRLAIFYPHAEMPPMWQVIAACLLLVGISVFVIRAARRFPYLSTGWLWYLGTLIPVIGLVQVGLQSMADRYTYVPLIGLFIIISWGVADLTAQWRYQRHILATLTGVALLALAIGTWSQVRHWHNSIALFTHTLAVTSNNYVAHDRLGEALFDQNRTGKAIRHYSKALKINPDFAEAHNNIGVALTKEGRRDEAIGHYQKALRINPDLAETHNNIGLALARQGNLKEAIAHFYGAVRINPDLAKTHYNLGVALTKEDRLDEAINHYRNALNINPIYPKALNNLGHLLARQGQFKEAIANYSEAVRIKPDFALAHKNLSRVYWLIGDKSSALREYEIVKRLDAALAKQLFEWMRGSAPNG